MKQTTFTLILICAFLMIVNSGVVKASEQGLRRFGLAIGSDLGGKGRDILLYAGSDAQNFRSVLEEMGGVESSDFLMLHNPDPRALEAAMKMLRDKVKKAGEETSRTEVVLYYSGHADHKGLLLGDVRYDYTRFRRHIDSIPADVRIAILDACASGAITRLKGGKRRPAFTVDVSSDMRGYAFLTSSSAEEASQESDRIGSSFFTHSLVSGLRGAADVSADGKVTLQEAYQFAFHETLARTERTKGGPQHPAYDMKLSGTGDVVMTDMRQTSAGLVLEAELEGRFFVRNKEGQLVAELYKPAGRPMELGFPSGTYSVLLEKPATSSVAQVQLSEGSRQNLADNQFRVVSRERTVRRGGSDNGDSSSSGGVKLEVNDQIDMPSDMPDDFTLSVGFFLNRQLKPFHGLQIALLLPYASDVVKGGQISALGNYAGKDLQGFQAASVGNLTVEKLDGLQGSGVFNIAGGKVWGGQGAGVFNISRSLKGGQGAGVLNLVAEAFEGVQGSGVLNLVGGALDGGQGAGVGNYVGGDFKGGQGAGVANFVGGAFRGGQGAGVANYIGGNFTGVQGAGVANAILGDVKGVQGSGVANFALGGVVGVQATGVGNLSLGVSRGVQAAGVFNGAKDITGAQVSGVINAARDVKGFQVGLVNISRDIQKGIPLGLINYSHTGLHNLNLWVDEAGYVHSTLLSGSRNFYTSFSIGYRPQYSPNPQALGIGMGVQMPIDSWFGAVDLNSYAILKEMDFEDHEEQNFPRLVRLRILGGREVVRYVSLFGGVSINYLRDESGRKSAFPWGGYQKEIADDRFVWPGIFAGVRVGQ